MKQTTPATIRKISFLFLAFLSLSFSTFAQDAPELKFLGISEGKLVFEFNYQSTGTASYLVEIVDQDGYQLFSERSKDKVFKKYFAIAKSDLESNVISVRIEQGKTQQKFDINRTVRTVEDVRIVRN